EAVDGTRFRADAHDQGDGDCRAVVMRLKARWDVLAQDGHDAISPSLGGFTPSRSTDPLVTRPSPERLSIENGRRSLLNLTQCENDPSHVRTAPFAGALSNTTFPRS